MSPILSPLLPHLALLTAMAFWGSTFVVLRVALVTLTPLQTMTGRMLVACLALLPLWPRLFRELRRNRHWGLLALMGLCEPCLFFLFETHALGLTTASQAGMVTAMLPLLVAVAAYMILGERFGPRVWLGFALAVGGVVWLSGTARPSAAAENPALGNLLEAAAMCCATGYTLLARRLSPFYSPLCITAVQAASGLIFFSLLLCIVPESAPRLNLGRSFPAWAPLACVVYLGGCVTFAGYGLYNLGVNRLSAGRAAAYTNLIPVFALFFGIALLDECLTINQYIGAVLIVAGVLCSQWRGGTAKKA